MFVIEILSIKVPKAGTIRFLYEFPVEIKIIRTIPSKVYNCFKQ